MPDKFDNFEKLDALLQKRKPHEAPQYLSARIIAAAARTPQDGIAPHPKRPNSNAGFWSIFAKPAFAFAVIALFIVSATFGAEIDIDPIITNVTAIVGVDDLATIISIEDNFTVGDWV